MQITQEEILNRTNYGLLIYVYILRLYYPREIVVHLKGYKCRRTKNPYNMHRQTLNIYKADERFYHYDTDKAIPSGDVFLFTAMHFGLIKDALYNRIVEALNIDLGNKKCIYKTHPKTV